ncbi:MAG: hypothetical protein ACXW5U_02045 [Thermoanaerobaculia bacterium]
MSKGAAEVTIAEGLHRAIQLGGLQAGLTIVKSDHPEDPESHQDGHDHSAEDWDLGLAQLGGVRVNDAVGAGAQYRQHLQQQVVCIAAVDGVCLNELGKLGRRGGAGALQKRGKLRRVTSHPRDDELDLRSLGGRPRDLLHGLERLFQKVFDLAKSGHSLIDVRLVATRTDQGHVNHAQDVGVMEHLGDRRGFGHRTGQLFLSAPHQSESVLAEAHDGEEHGRLR